MCLSTWALKTARTEDEDSPAEELRSRPQRAKPISTPLEIGMPLEIRANFAAPAGRRAVPTEQRCFQCSSMTGACVMDVMSLSEATTQLAALVERAAKGEDVAISVDGVPVARPTRLAARKRSLRVWTAPGPGRRPSRLRRAAAARRAHALRRHHALEVRRRRAALRFNLVEPVG